MKNTLIFLITLIISTTIYSQNQKVELPKKTDYKYWSFNMRKELKFDNITASNNLYWKSKIDPKLNKHEKQHWSYLNKTVKTIKEEIYHKNDTTKREEINLYTYDSTGNILEKIKYYDLNNEKSYSRIAITYNTHGNIIKFAEYTCNSFTKFKEKLEEKYLFTYDKKQNLIKEEKINATIKVFHYNSNNQIEKIEYFDYDPNHEGIIAYTDEATEEEVEAYIKQLKSKLTIRYIFKYNDLGKVILEKKEELIKSRYKIHTFQHSYSYNKNGTLFNFSTQNFTIDYEYDNSKLLLSETYKDLKYNTSKKAVREYDKKGNLIKYKSTRDYTNDAFENIYEYNNDLIIGETVYNKSYGIMEQTYSIKYEYDDNAFLTKSITTSSDKTSEETYKYDSEGKLLNYTRKNTLTNEIYNYKIYEYDENGGVTKCVWNDFIKRKIEYY
ncbi:hypothetical protein [uncultured Tenacibaculum sp.]|uniref:hypothetical protein n=1 Tax=uncultured Tenacibaculum sp. TaxID=174713 RepID=UPI00260AD58A|nr:hypothetical protein [uncultured Tenacibaculum sp.]